MPPCADCHDATAAASAEARASSCGADRQAAKAEASHASQGAAALGAHACGARAETDAPDVAVTFYLQAKDAQSSEEAGASVASRSLPLAVPAPPNKLTREDIQEYQNDLRVYRNLRQALQVCPLLQV